MAADLEMFEDARPEGALILVAFHSTGAAAPIAAAYLRQQMDLPLVGHVRVPELGPVAHVSEGIATSPIRILGGDYECTLGRRCERLYVITAELPVPVMMAHEVAQAIVAWAKGATFILCLDAVVRDDDDNEPDVFILADGPEALKQLGQSGAPPLQGGTLVGSTAALLAAGRAAGVPVGAFVVEAARNHPDGRAAAQLVQALDPLLPSIRIDPGPLLAEATELETQMAKAMREAEQAQPKRQMHTFI